jgi:hypothetical protein
MVFKGLVDVAESVLTSAHKILYASLFFRALFVTVLSSTMILPRLLDQTSTIITPHQAAYFFYFYTRVCILAF